MCPHPGRDGQSSCAGMLTLISQRHTIACFTLNHFILLQMLEDHLSEKALIPALRFVAENHPQRLARSDSKQQQKADEADKFEDNLHEIVVDGLDQRTRATGLGSSPERQMS